MLLPGRATPLSPQEDTEVPQGRRKTDKLPPQSEEEAIRQGMLSGTHGCKGGRKVGHGADLASAHSRRKAAVTGGAMVAISQGGDGERDSWEAQKRPGPAGTCR